MAEETNSIHKTDTKKLYTFDPDFDVSDYGRKFSLLMKADCKLTTG